MNTKTIAAALPVLLALTGCEQPPADQETGSVTVEDVQEARSNLNPGVLEALDAGNEAYREGNYQEALELYQQANVASEGGELAAAWFGIYMAELALGNTEAADEAMERARALAPDANLLHEEGSDDQ